MTDTTNAIPELRYRADWRREPGPVRHDPALETRVDAILAQMTVLEKIGQIIQPELYQVTPAEVAEHRFGSVLNGAGLFPNGDSHATRAEWVATVDAFWSASEAAFADRPFCIPFMWATDAVHGHNNLFGATIFPHNIGLGCMRDPALMREIGAVTAKEVAATGIDWTFAPNVTTPRDYRWGRHFEGYAESPALIAAYAGAMVEGLQEGSRAGTLPAAPVIACAKHWVADGGTRDGVDRGDCHSDEEIIRNVHAAGYFAAIDAGVQSVMVSFSGWRNPVNYDHAPDLSGTYNYKLSGSRYLVTDVLKGAMGFDGIVITDWDAHADVSRCSFGDAEFVINAGVDILMVSSRQAWKSLCQSLAEQIATGRVPRARIDDAVRRVLRVKMRAGLWEKPRPAARPIAMRDDVVGAPAHRALARRAARRSAVLLKNNRATLPLDRSARVLVTGSGAEDLRKQTGGWTLSWQSSEIGVADLPESCTIADAVRSIVGADRCTIDPRLACADLSAFDAVIVALGEDAYAEMRGNIRPWRSLHYATLRAGYAIDCDILRKVRAAADDAGSVTRIVTLFHGGRPLYLTEEINLSDAVVACWLPGPYNDAQVALLFGPAPGEERPEFVGRLSFSWPRRRRDFVLNHRPAHLTDLAIDDGDDAMDGDTRALFPYGYGLSYADAHDDMRPLPVDDVPEERPVAPAITGLEVFDGVGADGIEWMVSGHNIWSGQRLDFAAGLDLLIVQISASAAGDGVDIHFKGFPALVYARFVDRKLRDFRCLLAADARFEIEYRLIEAPDEPLYLATHDDYPSQIGLNIAPLLGDPMDAWHTLVVPMRDLAEIGMELDNVDTPFMLYCEGHAHLTIRSIRILLGQVPAAREIDVSAREAEA